MTHRKISDSMKYNFELPGGSSLYDLSFCRNSFFGALIFDWSMRFVNHSVCLIRELLPRILETRILGRIPGWSYSIHAWRPVLSLSSPPCSVLSLSCHCSLWCHQSFISYQLYTFIRTWYNLYTILRRGYNLYTILRMIPPCSKSFSSPCIY